MMRQAISKVIEAIANDIVCLAQLVIDENGLKNSILHESVQVKIQTEGNLLIDVFFADYIEYIENGQRPSSGEHPPIDALRDWAIEKGIAASNENLCAISYFIWKNGQAPRPILAQLEKEIEQSFENEWADNLFETVVAEIEKAFDQ